MTSVDGLSGSGVGRSVGPSMVPATGPLVILVAFLWLLIAVLATVGGFSAAQVAETSVAAGLLASLLVAFLAALGFGKLTRQGWGLAAATLLVLELLSQPLTLYMVTAAPTVVVPVVVAALLVLAVHKLADVGDVQAQIGLGLALCFAPLCGPIVMPLVLPVAIVAALADVDGRRDVRAFLSLLLVLLLPLAVTLVAIALVDHAPLPVSDLLRGLVAWGALVAALPSLSSVGAAPALFAALPLVAAMLLVLVRRRTVGSAITVATALLLPAYFEVARHAAGATIAAWVPYAVLSGTTVAVVLTAPATGIWRGGVLACFAVALALAWRVPGPATDPVWAPAVARPVTRLLPALAPLCPNWLCAATGGEPRPVTGG